MSDSSSGEFNRADAPADFSDDVSPDEQLSDDEKRAENDSAALALPPHADRDLLTVVGLGGSAGSIAPLQEFFTLMPPDSGLAFVVVVHISPDTESMLPQIIQARTSMKVTQVLESVEVEANHVYVIPPGKHLALQNGHIEVSDPDQPTGKRVAVDLLFRTLAATHRSHSVAVVLSGTDSDGAVGIKRIKEHGGITIAQAPDEAEHSGMPRAALDTTMVDWVLPVREMPARLVEFARNEVQLQAQLPDVKEPPPRSEEADEVALRDILTFLLLRTGHDFSHYKRPTVLRRIARRLQVNSLASFPDYVAFLRTHPGEAGALLQDLLISVTNFFRDKGAFEALEKEIPRLFEGKTPRDTIRVWVPGCATGEEAFSVAIFLVEYAETLDAPPQIQIFATDIDDEATRMAREALYPQAIAADVSPERLRRFFTLEQNRYRVKRDVRERILFASHNLLKDSPFSRLDLVSCRNLLIYFDEEAKNRVFELFHFALRNDGCLFLGSSETIDDGPLFQPIDKGHRIFQKRNETRLTVPLPVQPLVRVPDTFAPSETAPSLAPMRVLPPGEVEAPLRRAQNASFGEIHLQLVEQYAPPSVLVNAAYEVMHLSPRANRYLSLAPGEISINLIDMVHPSLRVELRATLFGASQHQEETEATGVPIELDGETRALTLRVRPLGDPRHPGAAPRFLLVVFDEGEADGARRVFAEDEPVAHRLESEIAHLRQQLRDTVEQYEASSEELKASNEELQAINEELRSSGEELETSREEIQAANEELTTLNQELHTKVEEVSRVNADLHNLITSTDIATIFLDRQLRIRRYTPRATELFAVIASDVGRPLADLRNELEDEEFARDATRVLNTLQPIEREAGARDGRLFILRIVPYRTPNDRIDGVVLTFSDITARQQAEIALRESEEKYRTLFNSIDEGFHIVELIHDEAGQARDYRVLEVNPAFERVTGLVNAAGQLGSEIAPNTESYWLEAFDQVARTGEPHRIEAYNDYTQRWYLAYISRVGEAGRRQVAAVFDDITERKRREAQQEYLLKLTDVLRPLSDPLEIQRAAMHVLGEHLKVDRALYGDVDASGETYIFLDNYVRDDYPKLVGRIPTAAFGEMSERLRAGETFAVTDMNTDERLGDSARAALIEAGVRAGVSVPLVKGNRWVANFGIHQGTPRSWMDDEIALIQETAERTWAAVERAHIEVALRESEAKLAADLAGMRRLYELHSRLANETDLKAALKEILAAACEFTHTERGCVQMISDGGERLEMVAWRGYADDNPFIERFRFEGFEKGCNVARVERRRLLVEDWTKVEGVDAETDALLRAENLRASQSTPMVGHSGETVGVLSTQFAEPGRPNDDELKLIDLLAWTAANFIERHRVNQAVRESERRLRALMKNLPGGAVFVLDRELRYLLAEGEALTAAGLVPEDLVGRTIFDALPPDLVADYEPNFRQVLAGESYEVEHEAHGRSFISRGVPLRDAASEENDAVLAISYDITERRNAEKALRESEARFRAVADVVPDLLWSNDPRGVTEWYNQRWLEYTGQALEEALSFGWIQAIHPDDRARSLLNFQDAIAQGTPLRQEHRIRSADGEYRWFLVRAEPLRDKNGKILRWFGAATDVHEQRSMLEALRSSEQQLRLAIESAQMGTCDWNYQTAEMRGNAHRFTMLGIDPAQEILSVEQFRNTLHPDDRERVWERITRLLETNGAYQQEYRVVRTDGAVRWIFEAGHVVERENNQQDGAVLRVASVLLDITEHRQTEETLRQSQEHLQLLIESATDYAILTLDPDGIIATWSAGAERTFGYSEDEIVGQPSAVLFTPEDRAAGAPEQEIETARRTGRAADERWHLRKDGSHFYVSGVLTPLDGPNSGFVKVARDLTQRKQTEDELQRVREELEARVQERTSDLAQINEQLRAENEEREVVVEALRRSEARFSRAFRLSPLAMVITTQREGRCLNINDAALDFFGVEREVALAHAVTDLNHWSPNRLRVVKGPRTREEMLRQVQQWGAVRDMEIIFTRPDGEERTATANVLLLEGQNEPSLLTMIADQSEQKRMEEARENLLRRLVSTQEAERRRISRDLHDRMGQTLTALMLNIKGLSELKSPETAPERRANARPTRERIETLEALTTELMESAHQLAWDLRPSVLDDFGLEAALREYVSEWSRRSGVRADFVARIRDGEQLPEHIESTLYRVTQEALTNVTRHAEAQHVSVLLEQVDNEIALIIEDDGCGFDPEAPENSTRLGVTGMRERAEIVGGTFEIESSADANSGTTIYVRVKINPA